MSTPSPSALGSEDELMFRLLRQLYIYKTLKGNLARKAGDGAETPNVLQIEVRTSQLHSTTGLSL